MRRWQIPRLPRRRKLASGQHGQPMANTSRPACTSYRMLRRVTRSKLILKTMNRRRPWQSELRLAVHDLGSPLSAIRVLIEVLRLTGDDAARKVELLNMMESQVDELAVGVEALTKYFTPSKSG